MRDVWLPTDMESFEDRVLFGFTLQQFITGLVGALLALVTFHFPIPLFAKIPLAAVFVGAGIALALVKINQTDALTALQYKMEFLVTGSRRYLYHHPVAKDDVQIKGVPSAEAVPVLGVSGGVLQVNEKRFSRAYKCSALNFHLLSHEERDAILARYRSFLDSLDFNVQVLSLARRVNINAYLSHLKRLADETKDENVESWLRHHAEFLESIIDANALISRTVYFVVTYEPVIKGAISAEDALAQAKRWFADADPKVIEGLRGCGIRAAILGDEELVDVIRDMYNKSRPTTQSLRSGSVARMQHIALWGANAENPDRPWKKSH